MIKNSMEFDFSDILPSENTILDGYKSQGYEVETVDGKKQGKGVERLEKEGKQYQLECIWENDKKNGKGCLLDADGIIVMRLNFNDDRLEDECILYTNGQVAFKGTWKHGKRNGICEEYKSGQLLFRGNYEEDYRNGYGIEYSSTKEICFEGNYVNGNRDSKYIQTNKKGKKELIEKDESGAIRYRGECKEGSIIREGCGITYDASGKPSKVAIYENNVELKVLKMFKDEKMTVYNEDGIVVYEGAFGSDGVDYVAEGKGKLYDTEHRLVYSGEFRQGRREGRGCSYYSSRILKYEGDWANDKANGVGSFNDEEGLKVAEGEWNDDIYSDGKMIIHQDTGRVDTVKKMKGCFC